MEIQTAKWKAIGLLLFLIFICLGLIIGLVSRNMDYLFSAVFAIFSFAFFTILPITQKRMSIYSGMALIIGLLFLASGIIELGYGPLEQNMSISAKTKFYTILNPPQISLGLSAIGTSSLLVLLGFRQITNKSVPKTNTQVYRMIYIAQIGAGIYLLATGFYLVIIGLYPSAYQLYRFSHISQELAVISLGLLISWYMIAQPLIEKKRGMASLDDKSV